MKSGEKAAIEQADWHSESPELARMLNALCGDGSRSYLPHPMLAAAQDAAEMLGAQIELEGFPEMDPPGG